MKIPIIFSTVTGNAFKIADKIKDGVEDKCGPYNIRYITDEVIDMFDTFILVYWCDFSSADKDTLELISKMKNKNILILGTAGVPMDSVVAPMILENVNEVVKKDNNLLGHFLCQGSIDLARTFRRLKHVDESKPKLSLEKFESYMNISNLPNETQLNEALEFVIEKLGRKLTLKD